MSIYELEDKTYDALYSAGRTAEEAVREAYELGKRDGAREALDVSQYVTDDSAEYDEGCGDLDCTLCYPQPEVEECPCGCGLTSYEVDTEADPQEDLFFTWTPDIEVEEKVVEDEIFVQFDDGSEAPLGNVITALAEIAEGVDELVDELFERVEYLEYEVGIKRVGSD